MIVGMMSLPLLASSTMRMPSALLSMSMNSYLTRCSPKNCLARLQSEHHSVPYMRMVIGRPPELDEGGRTELKLRPYVQRASGFTVAVESEREVTCRSLNCLKR